MNKIYRITLIHKVHDWDCQFEFPAPDAKTARKWAILKLAGPTEWLVTRAAQVKG